MSSFIPPSPLSHFPPLHCKAIYWTNYRVDSACVTWTDIGSIDFGSVFFGAGTLFRRQSRFGHSLQLQSPFRFPFGFSFSSCHGFSSTDTNDIRFRIRRLLGQSTELRGRNVSVLCSFGVGFQVDDWGRVQNLVVECSVPCSSAWWVVSNYMTRAEYRTKGGVFCALLLHLGGSK